MIRVGRTVPLLLCLVLSLVHCAAPPTATQLWSTPSTNNAVCENSLNSVPPVTLNGTTIFATMYYPDPGCPTPNNTISSVDDTTGAVVWNVSIGTDQVSSLILAGKHTVIVSAPSNVFGLSPQTGKLLWNFSVPASETVALQPMLSTDAKTLFAVPISSFGFSLFALDLTAPNHAGPVKLFSGSCTDNVVASYLVPVNGSDIAFLQCNQFYYNVNTSNPKQPGSAVAKSCYECSVAPPIVDAANALIYFAAYTGFVVNDYATGTQVATYTLGSYSEGSTLWAFAGFSDPTTGALTQLTAVSPLFNPSNTFELLLITPYSGNTQLQATTQIFNNWQLVQATPSRLFLVNATSGGLAALDLSTGGWLWKAPSVFTPNPYPVSGLTLEATLSRDTLYVTMTGADSVNPVLAIDTETGACLWQYPTVGIPGDGAQALWIANDPDTTVGDVTLVYNRNNNNMGATLTAVVGTTTGSGKLLL